MREVDFLELWEKEIWKKRLAIGFAFFFFVLFLFTLLSSGEKRTEKDRVMEYVLCRLNYTSYEVDRAYLDCPYQYKGVGYESATQSERDEIKRNGITSFFYPSSIEYDAKGRHWIVYGKRLIVDNTNTPRIKEVSVYIGKNSGKFLLEKINE
jgi:hypothetical protein